MTTKFARRQYFWIVLIFLLVACGTFPTEQAENTPTVSVPTLAPAHTPVALPTFELLPTVATTPAPTPLPISTLPIFTSPEKFPLDNIRMVYMANGNLYTQEGINQPMQLTNSGEDLDPILSNDGEKIVFYRGKINDDNNVHSINADGSQEQSLITNDWLTALGPGTKAGFLAFVPGTHQLLFDTYLCPGDLSLGCTTGLFSVDTDTGEIKEILPPSPSGYLPWGGRSPWHGNFAVSPDGELVSIAISGHIDIFTINGIVSRRNVMTYTRSTPIELFPRVFWRSDSSGLITALPAERNYGGTYEMTPTYTVWRYDFDSNSAIQVPFDPSPMWIYMECSDVMYVSSDGNWIIFNRLDDNTQLYAGNLNTEYLQPYPVEVDCSPVYWSADSKHFAYGRLRGTFRGDVNESLIPIDGNFLGWIDSTHFMYSHFPNQKEVLVGEIGEESITNYESGISLHENYYPYSFTFVVLDHKTKK